jgi:hypothetical protein
VTLAPMDEQVGSEEGEYYGEVYGGQGSSFDWFWFAITWLTVPLLVAYLIYRFVT